LHDLESPEEAKSMTLAKKCGFNRVAVAKSTIAGAGYGLFLSKGPVKARTLLTSYEGETLTAAQVEEPGRDLSYVYCSGRGKDGRVNCVDALRPDSSFGRFCNDPGDDTLVNAKVVLKGGRLMVMATTDITEGDEIFLDYGLEYWIDRLDLLPHEDAREAWDRAQRFGLKMDVERPRVKRKQREEGSEGCHGTTDGGRAGRVRLRQCGTQQSASGVSPVHGGEVVLR
jgi:hypothetical protein